jgi:PAS domain S-box-containing protein
MKRSPQAPVAPDAGQMSARIRAHDWGRTPLGPPEAWPPSLRTAMSIVLGSRYPMFLWWGPELINLYNDPYIPVLGRRHPEALGRPAREIWSEIWDTVGPQCEAVVRKGESTWNEDLLLLMQRHGYTEETFFTFSYSPVIVEDGSVGGMFCACNETTGRVLGERRLAALRKLASLPRTASPRDACLEAARLLEANARDVPFALLYLLEPDGGRARLHAASGLRGGDPGAPEWIDPAAPPAPEAPWPLTAALAGETRRLDGLAARLALPGGPWPEAADTALLLPLKGPHGPPLGVLVAGTSPRRPLDNDYQGFLELVAGSIAAAVGESRIYAEEHARAEALAELDRAKTAFFSDVSHELRTPLTLLLGPLEDELAAAAAPSENLRLALRNARRLHRLVNTLLDFARLEGGRLRAHLAPVDLAAETLALASGFRPAMERAGLRFELDCPPLPAPVAVDLELWEKLVLNLLSNALKFTLHGSVRLVLRALPERVELRVADTGSGIPAAELPRLFERFHRVRGVAARSHEGTGIGLALVREIARLHGGDVSVESVEGRGSTFIVTVPRLAGEAAEASASPAAGSGFEAGETTARHVEEFERWLDPAEPEPSAVSAAGEGALVAAAGRPRVLVVDDNADMRDYLRRLLAPAYTVEVAADGLAAWACVERALPDLVLSDVMLPGLDGFGLLRRLRAEARTRSLPVVLLSARAGEEARVGGLEAGADDYLVKPFAARELLARLRSQIELAKLRRESADRVARILDNISDGFHTIDAAGRYTAINPAARALFVGQGVDPESLLGRQIFEVFPELLATAGGQSLRRALVERAPTSTETFYHPWGRWYWIRNQPTPDGGVASFIQDITERRAAEERLRRALADLEAVYAQIPVGMVQLDHELRYVRINEMLASINGRPPSAHIGRTLAEIVPEVAPFLEPAFRRVLETGEPQIDAELHAMTLVEPRQPCVWLQSCFPLRDDAGRIIGLNVVVRDITEQKRNLEAVRLNEERFRTLANIVADVPWVLDPEGCFTSPQPAWEHYTGQAWEQHRERGWLGAVHPEDRAALAARWVEVSRGRGLFQAQIRLWSAAEGRHRHVVARATPLLAADGAVREWIGACTDVHEEREAAENLERLVAERTAALEEKIAEIETFSYSIAHDMRAPLRSMRGFSELLLAEHAPRLDDEGREFLRRIAASALRMDRLIQDILGYSRVMQGEPPRERVELEPLLRGLIESYPFLHPSKAEILIEGDLPPVRGSEALFTQVFSNLLGNAVKFVEPGVKPRVRIWAETGGDEHVRVFVRDNGIGIAESQQRKVFAIFQQVDRNSGGTGIGLAIVKKAIERMGGAVGLQSELSVGSTFVLRLRGA